MIIAKKISKKRIWAVLKKEFIQLWRDKVTLRMIVGIPIMQMLIFGFAINSDPKDLPTAVISQDHSIISRNILTGLKNSEYFNISHHVQSEEEARLLLQKGQVIFTINIPGQFYRKLVRGHNPKLLIEADGSDPIAISGALSAVNKIVEQVINRDTQRFFETPTSEPLPYELRIHRLYNPEGLTNYNIVPGLVAVVLTMTGIMMTALSLTRERERGTMENLLSMPVKPIEVMIGKITPYIIICYIQSAIIIATARYLFGVPILGNLTLLAVGLLIFILCNLALGFTLSTLAKNQMQAIQMSMFLLLPSILLSGFMFPFLGMPNWAQVIGSMLPSTYFIRIVRSIMIKGGDFIEIWPNLWPLLIFMLVVVVITMRIYKRTLD
ncbi:MAG: ABC transporter permease [Rickettsiaceae bacterium]|nr:ABC transporter permease [Rickettsiaceae bacterium]